MLEERLFNALEVVAVALFSAGLFFLFSVLARVAFKKSIGSSRYYTIAIVSGVLLHRVLVSVLPPEPRGGAGHPGDTPSSSSAQVGLDAPFIPPAEEDIESFPTQLDVAIAQLPLQERAQLSDAISFLAFSIAAHLAEDDPGQFDDAEDLDLAAKALVRIYRYAQKQDRSMTLRKYIDIAEEMKREKPEWWAQFQEAQALEQPSPIP